MGAHERLVHAWTPAIRGLRPDSEMEHARAIVGAINRDGTINQLALFNVLPWQPRDFYVSGTASVAANVAQMLRVRQESRLVYIDAYAKTAPSGAEWQGVIAITGAADLENISISSGQTAGTSPSNMIIPAGSLLQLNCVAANSAANVTVTIWTIPVL